MKKNFYLCRSNILRHMSVLLLLILFSIGNAWGAKPGVKGVVTPNPASGNGYTNVTKASLFYASTSGYYNVSKNATQRGTADNTQQDINFFFGAIALHGTKFTGWSEISTASTDNPSSAEVVSAPEVYYFEPALDGFVNYIHARPSVLKTSKTTASSTLNTYTYQANFATAEKKTVTIQKNTLGSVSCNAMYYGSGKVSTVVDLGTMQTSETESTIANVGDFWLYEEDCIILTATPSDNCRFYGWYRVDDEGNKIPLTTTTTQEIGGKNFGLESEIPVLIEGEYGEVLKTVLKDNVTFYAEFNALLPEPTENDIFLVNKAVYCSDINQALTAVGTNGTILMLQDYEIPAGNYTIPSGVTLLIPKNADQTDPSPVLERVIDTSLPTTAHRTLTLAEGAHLEVYGTIEVGCTQSTGTANGGGEEGISCPTGSYGYLYMKEGSSITLNNGALLRAWGYVLGDRDEDGNYLCEIDARRGSIVKEQFQIMDWKGGTYTMGMFDGNNSNVDSPTSHKVLPINQYYVQNVEVPVKYRPGAKLSAVGAVNVSGATINMDDAGVIGAKYTYSQDAAIFLMNDEDDSEDTWVRKYYDVATDQQVYEANNSAYLGSLVISFQGISADSREYKLPITNNFNVHLLNGQMEVTQHTEFLAGSELEINKESTLTIPQDVNVYLYDKEDWGRYISTTRNPNSTFTMGSGTTVKWRPGGRPTVRRDAIADTVIISDSKMIIHGTVDIQGKLFTTKHGATVTSTIADAGTVIFSTDAPANSTVSQITSLPADGSHDGAYKRIESTSVQLQNEDDTYTQTTGTIATEDDPISFCFIDFDGDGNGEWKSLVTNGCFVKDENEVWYIKPQEYVAISQGAAPVEEADHTYRDHYAGSDRIFILGAAGNCQWWEVRIVPGHPDLFECINENNHTFFYYDEEAENWMEKKFKVSWVNWDGSPVNYTNRENEQVNYYMVTYGTIPTWLSANPTHADDASHTYSFKGWLPTPAAVTEDVTYVAQYEERDRMYSITFNNESDQLIQVLYCKLGEFPVCTRYDAAANNKEWKTASGEAIGAVAKNETYKLYAKETKASYTIRFVNWNGDELQSSSVAAGIMPSAPAIPEKASDDLHSYTFKAWNPALVAADADATYTATYDAGPRGYTVLWKNGETTLETDENVPYGTVPEYNSATPTKDGHTFVGWNPAVSAVTGAATYTAQFMANQTIEDAQTIDANTEVNTITVETTGALTINNEVTLSAENLILKSTSEASGQIIPAGNKSKLNAINAYYDLTLGAPQARHWNAFGVPWVVNLDQTPLIELNNAGEPVGTLVLGRDYDIVYYNGAKRATQGPGYWCWEFVENHVHNLTPGKGYMIQFIREVKGIRFTKVNGTDFFYQGTVDLDENGSTSEYNVNNGWNAMSNPMPFHATMTGSSSPTVGYVHNGGAIGSDGYVEYDLEGKFLVGKTVYVQAGVGGANVSPVYADGEVDPIHASAPARRTRVTDKKYLSLKDYYRIGIAGENIEGGHIYVLPEEDKNDTYVIGHDLAQFGMSASIPQIWVNRYNTKLALNTTAPMNEVAEFPISVYAPAAGEYTLNSIQPSDVSDQEYTVYLTKEGRVIWNLSVGACTLNLSKGTSNAYGLRLRANKAPQVETGIDEAIVDAKGETTKVLMNGQVFIIRGEKVYTVEGQLVK